MPLSTSEALASTATNFPAWSTALFAACLVLMLATAAGIARTESRQLKRRIYWTGWMSTALCAAVSLLPLGIRTTIIVFGGFGFAIVFWAWLTTPYLKIGRRTFALTMSDSRPDPSPDADAETDSLAPPPDSYPGPVSAATVWWIFTILTLATAVGVFVGGWIWQTASVAAVLTFLGGISGLDDASRRLPAARGQYIQASLIAVSYTHLTLPTKRIV